MIFTSILFLIVAKALPSINKNISSVYFTRISAIIFVYAGVLSLNTLYIQSIGSGIGIYSGLFQITQVSVLIESFLLIIASLILIAWPLPKIVISPACLGKNKTSNNIIVTAKAALPGQIEALNMSTFLQGLVNQPQQTASNNLISKSEDYSLIVLFSCLGSCLLISCFDLVSLYICIELQSFGLYVLSTLFKDSETSTKAGLKYFLLGGLSSCIILLGCGLIYSYTGLTNFESIYTIISTSNSISSFNFFSAPAAGIELTNNLASLTLSTAAIQGLSLGLVLIFIGFLFKIAAAPLHNWSPDVYDEVPTIVTIWLTIIPKIAILILLLELQYYGFNLINISDCQLCSLGGSCSNLITNSLEENTIINSCLAGADTVGGSSSTIFNSIKLNSLLAWAWLSQQQEVVKFLLLISSFLSLLIGTVVGLAQTRIKRLLAYSTISHLGFILLALAINSESSIDSLIFYIIQYTITNLNIFLIIIALSYITASSTVNIFNTNCRGWLTNDLAFCQGKTQQLPGQEIRDIRYITELKGQIFSNPILSLSLAICLFSMAGIPPLIGFFSKQFVLYSAIQNGYYFISIIAILVSVISASYYLKIVKVIADALAKPAAGKLFAGGNIQENNQDTNEAAAATALAADKDFICCCSLRGNNAEINRNNYVYLSNVHSYVISVLTLVILLFILKPSLILNSTQLLSLSLFNW